MTGINDDVARQPATATEELDEWDDVRARGAIEALLLAADDPIDINAMLEAMPGASDAVVRRCLRQLALDYSGPDRGIHLIEVAGGMQLRTNPAYSDTVLNLFQARPTKLSRAAMETLAIVAYRQPVTRAAVDEIRGVDSGGILRNLIELELIAVIGKMDDIGRPNLYGTTRRFLEYFSLSALTDLPTLEEFEVDALELFGEDLEMLAAQAEQA